jgi:DNA-binding NarL/FixJ family response regulator
MTKRVLDVGNCDLDHSQIRSLVEGQFDARVVRCHGAGDALAELRSKPADLVIVNRILDRDQSQGLDIIREIKSDDALAKTPCVLLTNVPEHQKAALAAGADGSFGKAQLQAPIAVEALKRFL